MKIRFFLTILFILAIVISFILQGIYLPKNPQGEEKMFLIERGQGFLEISKNLEKEGLIKNRFYLNFYLTLTGSYRGLKTGEYLLSPSMTIPEIAKKIISGEVVKEKITIIEGWNLRDIGWYLENKGLFQAEELFEVAGFPLIDYSKVTDLPLPIDFSREFDFLKDKPKNVSLEGYLFPDTYFFGKGTSTEAIIQKTLTNFNKKLTKNLREEINRQGKTIFEIVTMASMIEKEVKTIEDKKMVSGILWKRLNNNIPLQVDATITYIKKTTNPEGVASRPYGARISIEDTQIDSPYNTYKYRGLPLGPISNPGLESILASVYPEESDYWYYLSTPEGKTIFSKALEEHNLAKAKYLK